MANVVVIANPRYTEEQAIEVARNFVIQDETYKSDGINGTLRTYINNSTPQVPGSYNVTVEFVCAYIGYGNRDGGLAALDHHKGYVIVSGNRVIDARLDDYWDMIKEEQVKGKDYPTHPNTVLLNASA